MANDTNGRANVYTQIRNMYCDGISYLNLSFYNMYLNLRFYPFLSKDNVGKSTYDLKNGQSTTVNPEGAYTLYQACKDIVDGKVQECNFTIHCPFEASLIFERKMGQSGQMETSITISKNGQNIPFIFSVTTTQVKINGKPQMKVIESGVGAFMKTVEGYLTGINADRHLDKFTEEYAKLQGGQQQQGGGYPQRGGYPQQGGYKKTYNGYRKPYGGGNQGGWQNRNNQSPPPQQRGMSDYQLPN